MENNVYLKYISDYFLNIFATNGSKFVLKVHGNFSCRQALDVTHLFYNEKNALSKCIFR